MESTVSFSSLQCVESQDQSVCSGKHRRQRDDPPPPMQTIFGVGGVRCGAEPWLEQSCRLTLHKDLLPGFLVYTLMSAQAEDQMFLLWRNLVSLETQTSAHWYWGSAKQRLASLVNHLCVMSPSEQPSTMSLEFLINTQLFYLKKKKQTKQKQGWQNINNY
jgi:hypothetical protein